jgi:hypothetical protein
MKQRKDMINLYLNLLILLQDYMEYCSAGTAVGETVGVARNAIVHGVRVLGCDG